MRISLFQVSSSASAVSRTSRAVSNPEACSHSAHRACTRTTRRAPSAASVTSKLSSTRPKQVTPTTFAGSYSPSAAASSCSHATTTSPSAASQAARHDCSSSASFGRCASSAQVGHTVAQVPHPMHRSGSMVSSLSS